VWKRAAVQVGHIARHVASALGKAVKLNVLLHHEPHLADTRRGAQAARIEKDFRVAGVDFQNHFLLVGLGIGFVDSAHLLDATH
jgi:hypothetical protein